MNSVYPDAFDSVLLVVLDSDWTKVAGVLVCLNVINKSM